jgi:hypothetical protein
LEDAPKIDPKLTFKYMLNLNFGERLDWAEENAKEEKDTIIEILENWIEEGRGMLSDENGVAIADGLEKVIKTVDDLENTNVGVRLALEQLLISL